MRRVIKPLEILLVKHKRIIVKDSAVNAICYGGQLTLSGVLRYDSSIETGEEIVLVTTKGEAVSLAFAVMTSIQIATGEYGVVAKTKRVIMDRDTYPKKWGLGPVSSFKKKLIKAGKLDKYGQPNEQTPEEWLKNYMDIGGNKWFFLQKPKLEAALGEAKDNFVPKKVQKLLAQPQEEEPAAKPAAKAAPAKKEEAKKPAAAAPAAKKPAAKKAESSDDSDDSSEDEKPAVKTPAKAAAKEESKTPAKAAPTPAKTTATPAKVATPAKKKDESSDDSSDDSSEDEKPAAKTPAKTPVKSAESKTPAKTPAKEEKPAAKTPAKTPAKDEKPAAKTPVKAEDNKRKREESSDDSSDDSSDEDKPAAKKQKLN